MLNLMTLMREYTLITTLMGKNLDFQALEKYKQKGITINTWPQSDLPIWKTAANRIYNDYIKNIPAFSKIYKSKMDYKKKYDTYYVVHRPYKN